jgi:hypothetical protein
MSIKTVITGYALLLAQSYVVTNPFFGETEIRKFIALRERFHPEFTQACLQLAQNIENGDYGHGLETAVPILRSVSQITRKDVHRAILAVTRAFRNLFASNLPPEMPGDIRNMVYLAKVCMHADQYGHEHKYLFEKVIQSNPEPTQIKTFLRQIIKLPVLATMTPLEEANPGAWFDMTPEKRVAIRSRMTQLDKELKNAFDQIQDANARSAEYKRISAEQTALNAEAGVPTPIIMRAEEEPLETTLHRESKLEADGPTAYLLDKLIQDIETHFTQYPDAKVTRRILNALLKELAQARTLTTAQRILRNAIDRKIISRDWEENIKNLISQVSKNKCVAEGIPLQPLRWKHVSPEEFITRHKLEYNGVVFPNNHEPDTNVLGKVSRAISDLEMVFGNDFCRMHKIPLQFKFTEPHSGALASYFMYDRKLNAFQPHVTLGQDFDGLIAHELSHFFDDALGYKLGTGGTLFVNTGVPLTYFNESRPPHPLIAEFVKAILASPDYARWEDYLSAAYENVIPDALAKHGFDPYTAKDANGNLYLDAIYKSQLPPGVVETAEKNYRTLTGGDVRKLTYIQSGVEIWARMSEQYVYTKLARMGISNPWLTRITYDDDPKFMEQKRFETTLEPILDRIFKAIKK